MADNDVVLIDESVALQRGPGEGASNVKHEYLDGQIYAMAGGTPAHAALQLAVPNVLFAQLRTGRCRALGSDLRVRVLATGLATYPDVTVVCGPRETDPEDESSVTNPMLLVEVLSPSTAEYDRRGVTAPLRAAGHHRSGSTAFTL